MPAAQPIPTGNPATGAPSVVATLLPIVTAIFIVYLVIGVAMPILPMHVHQGLGLGALMVGLVSGAQFTASLLSRLGSGNYADRRGGKRAVVAGLLGSSASRSRGHASCSVICPTRSAARAARSTRWSSKRLARR